MAASLQELCLATAPLTAAVVTTTVTLCPLYAPASTQSAVTLVPSDNRAPVSCDAESSCYPQVPMSDDGRNIQCNISEGKELTWPYLNSLDEDSEDEDSDSPKVWLAPELTKTLGSRKENGAILPSAVLSEIAQHSNREGRELERVPPLSREITGFELVPWVKPERVLEQSLLKSVLEKDRNSDYEDEEEEGVKAHQTRADFCQPLDNNYEDSEEQMET
eukprot:Em0015g659a